MLSERLMSCDCKGLVPLAQVMVTPAGCAALAQAPVTPARLLNLRSCLAWSRNYHDCPEWAHSVQLEDC